MNGPENLDVSTAIHSTTAMNQRDSSVLSRRSMLGILAVAAAAQPAGNDECGDLVLAAGKELNAFIAAVNGSYGRDVARRAVGYWLAVLEHIELLPGSGAMSFRNVTEQAAGRLAKDVLGI